MNRTNIIALPQARVRRAIECPWCDVWALRADSADNRLELAQHQVSRHPSHVFGAS